MRWKVVLQIAQGAEDCGMTRVFSDGYSDGFFSTSRADKDGGELLLDDADYSASSSPQWPRLYTLGGQDSIFTFGSMLFEGCNEPLLSRGREPPSGWIPANLVGTLNKPKNYSWVNSIDGVRRIGVQI